MNQITNKLPSNGKNHNPNLGFNNAKSLVY